MLRAALRELDDAGVSDWPETVLADAGYWHTKQMENIVSDGMQVLVPPDAGLRKDIRPGWDKGPYAFMRMVLSSEFGHELYKHRKATVEPVFAQNKFNRGFRRFQRRGRAAARSEWRLQAAVHNLPKLHNHWISPAIPRASGTDPQPAHPTAFGVNRATDVSTATRNFTQQPPPEAGPAAGARRRHFTREPQVGSDREDSSREPYDAALCVISKSS